MWILSKKGGGGRIQQKISSMNTKRAGRLPLWNMTFASSNVRKKKKKEKGTIKCDKSMVICDVGII